MEKQRASRTAEAAAATRAYYDGYRPPPIFSDPYARHFLTGFWKMVLATPLRYLVFERGLQRLKPVGGQVVARSRFAEDKLIAAISAGIEQYVIVGAGYDSFSLRHPELSGELEIFEIDHPATQKEKQKRLARVCPNGIPPNLSFVPVDFEKESLAAGMARSTFSESRPAFFSWLGTTPYLSNKATLEALRSMAELAAPGSQLVFDFLAPHAELADVEHRQLLQALKAFTARRGEPIIGEFAAQDLPELLEKTGWSTMEQAGFAEQQCSYFASRSDDAMPMPGSYLVHAAKTALQG